MPRIVLTGHRVRVLVGCLLLGSTSACYAARSAPALPVPVSLESSRRFALVVRRGEDAPLVCPVRSLSGEVALVRGDTLFLRRVTALSPRQAAAGCVEGVAGYVVADTEADVRARTAESEPFRGVLLGALFGLSALLAALAMIGG